MGIVNLVRKGVIEVWNDLYNVSIDDKAAPDLGDILKGKEEPIYSDPEEFFKRTYLTDSVRDLIEEVAETLKNGTGGKTFLLTSLFGGGKTHTQIFLYHAFTNPEKLRTLSDALAAKVAEVGKPIIVVMDGSRADLVPHPLQPFKAAGFTIKTIWGMLAYRLGVYAKMKHLDSENSPAPDVTLLKNILLEARGPILILLDEIVHYIFNLHKSPKLKDYGHKVLLFLDYLARAIEDTPKTALVASIQAEYRFVEGQKILAEEEVFSGYAGKVLSVLTRESTRIITPVSPDDVVKVLQRRIFKKLSIEEAQKARDRLYKAYREARELFGVESDWQYSTETGRIVTVKDTYPFHPKYIEVLREFVTRNRDLQKTRDAIRITRKVVRRLLKRGEDADFIMPWHIDLRDRAIRSRVLTESRREFQDVVTRDIISEEGRLGAISECSKPQLALKIATAILLKTYTYETFKEPLKVFPDLKEVALMVYEPETFSCEDLHYLDIEQILAEMHGRLPHFVSENGRYWFTPFPSVIEYVEKLATEKLSERKLELYDTLKAYSRDNLVRKWKGRVEKGEIFDEKDTIIIGYGDEVWNEITVEDRPSMRLVVIIKPDVKEEDIEKIILMKGESGKRIYRNTVAVVCPRPDTNFDQLLSYAAKIKAAEEVMRNLPEYYTDREIKRLQEAKLKKYRQDCENILAQLLLTTLTRIFYPARSEEKDIIKWTDTVPSSSIIAQVESGLKDARTGPKLRTDFSFNDLNDFLKHNQNWDLIEGWESREFREILEVFYQNPIAPFTSRDAVERAIKEGLQSFDIGLMIDGKLYWKRIGPENGAEIAPRLKDSDEILPYRLAARKLKDELLANSGEQRVDNQLNVTWYEVIIANKQIRLEDLILQENWEKMMKLGIILKQEKTIERGFVVDVSPSVISIKSGEKVQVKVSLKPVSETPINVELNVDKGKISPRKGKLPLEALWDIGILTEPGEKRYKIEVIGEDGTKSSAYLTVTVESLEKEIESSKVDISLVGAKLIGITPKNFVSLRMALDTVIKLGIMSKANIIINFGDELKFISEDADVKITNLFIQRFAEIMKSMPSLEKKIDISGIINFKEPVTLDSSKIAAFSPLSDRVSFKLRVVRK